MQYDLTIKLFTVMLALSFSFFFYFFLDGDKDHKIKELEDRLKQSEEGIKKANRVVDVLQKNIGPLSPMLQSSHRRPCPGHRTGPGPGNLAQMRYLYP